MPTLEDILGRPLSLDAVKEDGAALIREVVQGQRGLKGRTLVGGLRAMEAAHQGFLESAVGRVLPVFAPTLQAHYDQGVASGDVGAHFARNERAIADDLLAITDSLAEATRRRVVAKGYRALRLQARGHVLAGLPRLADLLVKHLG